MSATAQDKFRRLAKEKLAKAPRPKMGEVAAEFVELAGGPKMFAKHLWNEFTAADVGSLVRQKTIALVASFLKTDEELSQQDVESMTEDELRTTFMDVIRMMDAEEARRAAAQLPAADPAAAEAGGDGPEAAEGEAAVESDAGPGPGGG